MDLVKPFFMYNDAWYYYDEKEFKYKLTDKAPYIAKLSYEKFYFTLDHEYYEDENGETIEVDYPMLFLNRMYYKTKIKTFFKRFRKK